MSQYRPLRPYFYRQVAILGVPLRDWKISLIATVLCAVFLYFTKFRLAGIPLWFVLSILIGLGIVSFFLWAHNGHKKGWIEYSARYWFREITGTGQNLHAEPVGRRQISWLVNTSKTKQLPWLS